MGAFILARLKAFAALVAVPVATAVVHGAVQAFGIPIDVTTQGAIIALVTGLVVHQVPNITK